MPADAIMIGPGSAAAGMPMAAFIGAADSRRLHRVAAHLRTHARCPCASSSSATVAASIPSGDAATVWSQVLILQGGRILLGRHRQGAFEGQYTGFIGAVEPGETTSEAACRIVTQQSGLVVEQRQLRKRAVLQFCEADKDHPNGAGSPSAALGPPLVEHEFVTEGFSGTPTETASMTPTWFDIGSIPFDQMPKDDALWYP